MVFNKQKKFLFEESVDEPKEVEKKKSDSDVIVNKSNNISERLKQFTTNENPKKDEIKKIDEKEKSNTEDIVKKSNNIAERLKQFSSNEIPKKIIT